MSTLKSIVKIHALSDKLCLESKLSSCKYKPQSLIQVFFKNTGGRLEGFLVLFLAVWASIPSCSMFDPIFLYYIRKDPLLE